MTEALSTKSVMASGGKSTPCCLLVLGMHRSGTSAVSRIFNLFGARLPDRLMGPSDSNLRGHWESAALSQIHDELLRAGGSCWDDAAAFRLSSISKTTLREFKERILRVLAEEYGPCPIAIVKDPRICRFVPFWLEILHEAGLQVRVLLTIRNPMEVTRSLWTRDLLSIPYGYLLWARHVLEAERSSRGMQRAVIFYDEIMADWRASTAKVARQLGITLNVDTDSEIEADVFLAAELKHHSFSIEDLKQDEMAPSFASTIYKSLLAFASNSVEDCYSMLDRLHSQIGEHGDPVFDILNGEIVARRKELDWRFSEKKEVARTSNEIARLNEALREIGHELHQRDIEIQNRDTEIQQLNTEIRELNNQLAVDRPKLAFAIAELHKLQTELAVTQQARDRLSQICLEREQQLSALLTSKSWRLTKPVRELRSLLRFPRISAHGPKS